MSIWTSALQSLKPEYTSPDEKTKLYYYPYPFKYAPHMYIKQLTCESQKELQKAITEAEIAQNNPHPNLCECYGWEVDESYLYIFFETMDRNLKHDIDKRLSEVNYYTEDELWYLLYEVLKGLVHLQKLNIAHRDIKPENILLNSQGEVKICDFGFAKKVEIGKHTLLGTCAYFSPLLKHALIQGGISVLKVQHNPFKSDVYSLGVVCIYLTLLELPQFLSSLKNLQTNIDTQLHTITRYSSRWVEVLEWMLKVEEVQRPDFLQLWQTWHFPQPYADDQYMPETPVPEASGDQLQVLLKCGLQQVRVSMGKYEEVPCMLSLIGNQQENEIRTYSTDFVCVIDESASMQNSCMDLVKSTLFRLVEQLRDSDRLCIIGFSDEASRKCPLLCCSEEGKNTLKEKIATLTPQENTNIAAGLKMALETLTQRRVKNTSAAIFLFTDGRNNIGGNPEDECSEALLQLPVERLSVHCLGYGNDLDTPLLEEIANKGNGAFFHVTSPEDISKTFAYIFGGLTSVVARNITVEIQAKDGKVPCMIDKVYSKDGSSTFHLSDISANQRKDLIFFLKPSCIDLQTSTQFPVVLSTVTYFTTDGTESHQEPSLSVKFVKWTDIAPPQDSEVFSNWYRVKGGAALREARELANAGDFQAADQRLAYAIEDLDSGRYADCPMVASVLKDLKNAREKVRSEATWKQGGEAHFASISYSHQSQIASAFAPQYASEQQKESVERMVGRLPEQAERGGAPMVTILEEPTNTTAFS